jgi:hypothetical protein
MRAVDRAPSLKGPRQSRCLDRVHGPVAARGARTGKRTNDAWVMITRASNVLWRAAKSRDEEIARGVVLRGVAGQSFCALRGE